MLDFKQNYFELFSLPESFDIDTEILGKTHLQFQQALHPDKFANGTAQEKLYSVQAAAHVNEAYAVLREDIRRASYILLLNGIDIEAETDTHVDPSFLMQQIELRESLEQISSSDDPLKVATELESNVQDQMVEVKGQVSEQMEAADFGAARDTVRKWQFLRKMQQELDETLFRIEEALDR